MSSVICDYLEIKSPDQLSINYSNRAICCRQLIPLKAKILVNVLQKYNTLVNVLQNTRHFYFPQKRTGTLFNVPAYVQFSYVI